MKKVLIFSSLCKSKEVLEVVLPSWVALDTGSCQVDMLLYDDNNEKKAIHFLADFEAKNPNVQVQRDWIESDSNYKTHNWNRPLTDRITFIKNKAISYALDEGYDYIFLLDADLVIHPTLLQHLMSCNKDFVFEVFWTVFHDQTFAKPNCWDIHSWNYIYPETILQLPTPGTYKVGAGGACTLLTRNALEKGVNFERIENMPYAGEDRHICTRAEVLGVDIYIDTHYPAFHIFKNEQSKEASTWYTKGCNPRYFDTWLDEHWKTEVHKLFVEAKVIPPKNKIDKYRRALYKAKRAYINYMRYN
ncbi:hypothetical protein [uncultured Dokdonia sp.]|uniref:hypothetical protein n=1 Tax=uncultured Dokdonia sp. TaxID=575653 RepID=UPI002619A553|nr:hypothetical protein [uncultured Dokdonia sp.]